MARLELRIEGMSGPECVEAVQLALEDLPGVELEHVEAGAASLLYNPDYISEAAIMDVLAEEGFSATPD